MATLKTFPTARTMIGTLMAIGWTTEAIQGAIRLVSFAVFELNGRLESYKILHENDYALLLHTLNNKAQLFASGLTVQELMARRDLQVQSSAGDTICLYEKQGYEWVAVPHPAKIDRTHVPPLDGDMSNILQFPCSANPEYYDPQDTF